MRTLVVYCHPDAASFTSAVRDSALAALRSAGHDVRFTDLYEDEFDPVLSEAEHVNHLADPSTKPAIARYVDDLRWCRSLVLIYPTWWAGQPAMLKGWIDRVWMHGVAWELAAGSARLRPLLRNVRSITVVTTHGSSKWVNALEGEVGKRTVTRVLRSMCSRRCRTRWIALYGIDRSTDAQRQRFLARITRRLGR